jgi:hypothetical protein
MSKHRRKSTTFTTITNTHLCAPSTPWYSLQSVYLNRARVCYVDGHWCDVWGYGNVLKHGGTGSVVPVARPCTFWHL